jgi:NAD(P)-dependent dehydrogenase (short-subunit alcohol dehydrogenase family)
VAERRFVIISGVSRGLGRAMTEHIARRGHIVAGCARSADEVERLSRELPRPHSFSVVDVCRDEEVAQWAAEVAKIGSPDLVLNNAAIINRNARLWEVPPDEFSQLVDINIKGVFHVARHFLPPIIRRGDGVLVNFSSTWGRTTSPEVAPYCASKWAIEGLTQALASELPRGVAAVALNPGVIHTKMLESCFASAASAYPSPDQWAARAVPFLLELSSRHNGQSLTVPG